MIKFPPALNYDSLQLDQLYATLYRYAEDLNIITEKYQSLNTLCNTLAKSQNSLEHLKQMFDASVLDVPELHVVTDLCGAIQFTNPAARNKLIEGGNFFSILDDAILESSRAQYFGAREEVIKTSDPVKINTPILLVGNNSFTCRCVPLITSQITTALYWIFELSNTTLLELAYYDWLTKLPNRLLFEDRLKQLIAQSNRTGKTFALLFIDLDGFKAINDLHGHQAGDEVLINVANSLTNGLRNCDTVARWAGDEFVILATGISSENELDSFCKKILDLVTTPVVLFGEIEIVITASIGCVEYPQHGHDEQELIHRADSAMYRAKNSGKNSYFLVTTPYT